MKKILITGGPVHAHLDSVKIITNSFRDGLMAKMADMFSETSQVTYLTSKMGELSAHAYRIVYHDGFHDYYEKVTSMAADYDAVILGAAVANLIPTNPIEGKFPSHNYNVGDIIPINFTIAPRIIDQVKKTAPHVHLFGFKLLDSVDHDVLVKAAYDIVLSSKATAVIANDRRNLMTKHVITKERAVHTMDLRGTVDFVNSCINDVYYRTETVKSVYDTTKPIPDPSLADKDKFYNLINQHREDFTYTEEGYVFGTVAVKTNHGFLTTGRGKNELDETSFVYSVNHDHKVVTVMETDSYKPKASLNAPLLDHIFRTTMADSIIHLHKQLDNVPTLPYAPPGTVRDSIRSIHGSFNIENHGCFLLFREGNRL